LNARALLRTRKLKRLIDTFEEHETPEPGRRDAGFADFGIDLVYTDSISQRAEQLCSILTSAIEEETRANGAGISGPGQPLVHSVLIASPMRYVRHICLP
jgi:hypothetical protein